MSNADSTYWQDGNFCKDSKGVDITDRGFLLGDGIFETILMRNSAPLFLTEHLRRMKKSASALRLALTVTEREVLEVLEQLAALNDLKNVPACARLSLTRRSEGRGIDIGRGKSETSLLITVTPYDADNVSPLKFVVSHYQRSEKSICASHKTLNYLDNIMARAEAKECGGQEGILLNSVGRVACAAAANIFLIQSDDEIITPTLEEGALPGIVRQFLLNNAERVGIAVTEAPITDTALRTSSCFLTNSLMGIRAAFLHDQHPPSDRALAVIQKLQSCYADAIEQELQKRTSP